MVQSLFSFVMNLLLVSSKATAAVAPHTSKIIENGLHIFEREENLLQNSILHFVFKLNQSSEIGLQS